MSPRALGDQSFRETPLLERGEQMSSAVKKLYDSGLPALPVVDGAGKLCGIFGEREFVAAVFPGYLGELKYAAFVTRGVDEQIEKRRECLSNPVEKHMNTEHIDVSGDWSDAQVAEIFLHHRVLIVPIVDGGKVAGVITRNDFFRTLVERTMR